jgi:hypothetical protein
MIWHFIYRWLYRDVWCVTYPNWIASAAVVILGYIYGKKEILKVHRHLDANHAALKEHISKVNKGVK